MDTSNSILDALMLQVEAEAGTSTHPPSSVSEPSLVQTPTVEVQKEIIDDSRADGITTNIDSKHIVDHGSMDIDQPANAVQDLSETQRAPQTVQEENTILPETTRSTTVANGPAALESDGIDSHGVDVDMVPMETGPAAEDFEPDRNTVTSETPQLATEPSSTTDNIAQEGSSVNVPETISALPDASALIDGIPPDNTIIPGLSVEGAEWEIDSSPYQSSDSDSSSDTTSDDDSDDDADGDYAMLDPEEAARILMQGDGGSDDEGGRSKDKSGGGLLCEPRTKSPRR